jgi:hypothetical protein
VPNHRAASVPTIVGNNGHNHVSTIDVVWRGNSGKDSYGGPVISFDTDAVVAADGEAGPSSAGETEEVKTLKRKNSELQEENTQLKDKLSKVKDFLA